MSNPHTSSNSNWASIILAVIERERLVSAMGNLSAVAPKIWCDLHLLRILAKGRRGSFLTLSRRRHVLSLCLPCPDRAILDLEDTQGFWRGCGPSPSSWPWPCYPLRLSHTSNENFGHNWRVRNSKSLKGLQIKGMTSHRASYMGGKPSDNQFIQISKKELQVK